MVLLRACPILKLIQPMVHPDSRLRHGRFRNFPLSFTFLTDVRWTEILQEKRHFIRSNFGYPHLVTILTAYATWKWILKHFKNIILREHAVGYCHWWWMFLDVKTWNGVLRVWEWLILLSWRQVRGDLTEPVEITGTEFFETCAQRSQQVSPKY